MVVATIRIVEVKALRVGRDVLMVILSAVLRVLRVDLRVDLRAVREGDRKAPPVVKEGDLRALKAITALDLGADIHKAEGRKEPLMYLLMAYLGYRTGVMVLMVREVVGLTTLLDHVAMVLINDRSVIGTPSNLVTMG